MIRRSTNYAAKVVIEFLPRYCNIMQNWNSVSKGSTPLNVELMLYFPAYWVGESMGDVTRPCGSGRRWNFISYMKL